MKSKIWKIGGVFYTIIKIDQPNQKAILKDASGDYAVLLGMKIKKKIPLNECQERYNSGNIGKSYTILRKV
jgi:hypothetical protein